MANDEAGRGAKISSMVDVCLANAPVGLEFIHYGEFQREPSLRPLSLPFPGGFLRFDKARSLLALLSGGNGDEF
jgi:hypothetical protein